METDGDIQHYLTINQSIYLADRSKHPLVPRSLPQASNPSSQRIWHLQRPYRISRHATRTIPKHNKPPLNNHRQKHIDGSSILSPTIIPPQANSTVNSGTNGSQQGGYILVERPWGQDNHSDGNVHRRQYPTGLLPMERWMQESHVQPWNAVEEIRVKKSSKN